MKKRLKNVLILILCAALIGGSVMMIYTALSAAKYDKDKLRSCSVSTGGGMLGGSRTVSLKRDADGAATLSVSQKETHADREITTTYRVDDGAFDRVRDLVAAYDLYRASKRPRSRMQVLDGDTTHLYFSFSKGSFSISDNQVLSGKMTKGWREVVQYLDSLAVGEGIMTKEPQRATLYLRSGYTLQFIVEDAFDGKLDAILGVEREVSAFGDSGIVLAAGETPDLTDAAPTDNVKAGDVVYDTQSRQIILLYEDHAFLEPVYLLARLDGYVPSAAPLIAEMEGAYNLYLNE